VTLQSLSLWVSRARCESDLGYSSWRAGPRDESEEGMTPWEREWSM
jgi:hypothetical protein